ncbi:hypothetical protein LJC46_08425 [Desulfovibrio sp. OttesenSCG-928-G15]|nr:hypothetical protein [Desulfovibrio sp. OttesenSCG-928-G15]
MTLGGTQRMLMLSEQGLYFFLARSDKPLALPFQKWLAGEVLPAIRKHGGYLTPKLTTEALIDPDVIINLALQLKAERQKAAIASQKATELAAKAAELETAKAEALTTARKATAAANQAQNIAAQAKVALAEAAPKAALVDSVFAPATTKAASRQGGHRHGKLFKLIDIVRKLSGVNTMAIHRDLLRTGYLYKKGGVYRVYSEFRDKLFVEKYDDWTGKTVILATVDGAGRVAERETGGEEAGEVYLTNRANIAATSGMFTPTRNTIQELRAYLTAVAE